MKITIKQIAKEAEVSIATVSIILNKKDKKISEATRQRVLDIVKKYNYIPNAMAGSLVTKRTGIIGLILPDITNPFFPEIARGAEDKASEEGFNLIFCNTDDKLEAEEKYIESLTGRMVDGIIIAHSASAEKTSEILERSQIPIVLVDRDLDSQNIIGKVLVDNEEGAYQGVKYLILKGYRKIAFLSGSASLQLTKDRLRGYQRALLESQISTDESLIKYGQYRSAWGREGTKKLIQEHIDFDAIFCGNDLIAIGAMKELKVNGYCIPEDIAVMGFDDIYISELVEPELTTVRQPNYEMGQRAAGLLIEYIKHKDRSKAQGEGVETIYLNTEIIERKSVIALKKSTEGEKA